jgi:two-component system phosphate regulon sensor histidine kinase PhoR
VSHELKTPLTSILGFVETLKDGAIEDRLNRLKFLQIIEDHSKKLQCLIEDLLFLSKMESQKDPLRRQSLDLEKLLERSLEVFSGALKEKKIQLEKDFTPTPFRIEADPVLLERALSNLIDNAIKYNRPGGKISVRASKSAGQAAIRISDTGIGIAESDLPRIFERFYRAEKSRSRESGGTGLGLSITKHVAERHGGSVAAQSVLGEGSSFTLTIPEPGV